MAQGNIDKAIIFFNQDFILFREVGDKAGVAHTLQYQGLYAHFQGDDTKAESFLKQGLMLAQETGPRWLRSNYLLWLADIAIVRGQLERATWLCSAAKVNLAHSASFWDAFETSYYEKIMALCRASLGADAFSRAQAEGQSLPTEEAIAIALEDNCELK